MILYFQGTLFLAYVFCVKTQNCQQCVNASNTWCVESSQCFSGNAVSCNTTINDILNCPMYPRQGFEYSDNLARNIALPYMGAIHVEDPSICIRNHFPSATINTNITVACVSTRPEFPCYAYTAVDPQNEAIVVMFRGTAGGDRQTQQELDSFSQPMRPFFNHGHLNAYYYDSSFSIWQGSLGNDTFTLKAKYPNYKVWVFGYSLGAAQASIYASYLLAANIYAPENVRLLTIGQPRVGDRAFAQWHDETFLYSYRVVHDQDSVPHDRPSLGGVNGYWHHCYEVWYENNMTAGQPYSICPESDGDYCSNKYATHLTGDDHDGYFGVRMNAYARSGCIL